MSPVDEILVEIYSSFGSSVDRIASSSVLRSDFRSRLPEIFRATEDDELVRRLLNLRKRGKLAPTKTRGGKV